MSWIKWRTSLCEGAEARQLARHLGCHRLMALGAMNAWISWLDEHTEDGKSHLLPSEVDDVVGLGGMTDGLISIGWARLDAEGCVEAVDYEKHNGNSAKKRAETALRVARSRVRNADVTDNPPKCNDESVTSALPREDKIRDINVSDECVSISHATMRADMRPQHEQLVSVMKDPTLGLRPEELDVCAAQYIDAMDERGWVTNSGMPVTNWMASARRWARSWASRSARESIRNGAKSPAQGNLTRNRRDSNDGAKY